MAGFHVVVRSTAGLSFVRSRNPRGRVRFTRSARKAAIFPTADAAARVTRRFRATKATTTFRVEAL